VFDALARNKVTEDVINEIATRLRIDVVAIKAIANRISPRQTASDLLRSGAW